MRFSINFFTSIGLGPVTDGMREHLKNLPRLIATQQPAASDSDSDSSSGKLTALSMDQTARLCSYRGFMLTLVEAHPSFMTLHTSTVGISTCKHDATCPGQTPAPHSVQRFVALLHVPAVFVTLLFSETEHLPCIHHVRLKYKP